MKDYHCDILTSSSGGACKVAYQEIAGAHPNETEIERGVVVLQHGGLVAFPTDTVYGLGASSRIASSVERIFVLKKRPRFMGLPLLLSHVDELPLVARVVPPLAYRLAEVFWPGALTMVLYKTEAILDVITGGSSTVAVRVPAHPVPRWLCQRLGAPLVGTSANISGKPSAVTAAGVRSQFAGGGVDLVMEGGPLPGGQESTILDLTAAVPTVLREGAIPISALRHVCGAVILAKGA
jgi:L-threonylcarbamoyladenylate synthase